MTKRKDNEMAMSDEQFKEFLEKTPLNQNIQKYLMVTRIKLSQCRRISISYSGGSDSDIVIDIVELIKPKECGEIRYVFIDTGLEWDATIRHVSNTEQKYGVTIEPKKSKVTIPTACKKHGIPFIAKEPSHYFDILQQHNFDWNDTLEAATIEKYGKCKSVIEWWFCVPRVSKNGKKRKDISRFKYLREFIKDNPPDFQISKKCCTYAKINVSNDFNAEFNPDLLINGMRQAENGVRSASIKNCFTPTGKNGYAEYRPLWFWTDEDKRVYKEWRGIKNSDCYEIWGFERTGCVGCPCSSNVIEQLQIAKQYEPNKVNAAYAVFGKSYEYREKYNEYKKHGGMIQLKLEGF